MKKETAINEDNKKKSALKKVLGIIGNIMFFAVLILAAVVIFFTVQSKMAGGTPGIGGYKIYMVLSGSMEPAIHTGSAVIVQPADVDKLAVNDIITFKGFDGSNTLITHRIAEVNKEQLSFTTKGDANDVTDPNEVPASDVVGKVSFSVPYAGYVMNFAKSKMGLLVLVILPGTFIIALEIRKLFKYISQNDKEKQEKLRAQILAELEQKAAAERSEATENA